MKLIPLFIFLFLGISCGRSQEESSCEEMICHVSEYTLPTTVEGEVPYEAMIFDHKMNLVNFGVTDTEKVQMAAELIKKVVASQDFKDAVVNHTFNGEKTFANNQGLTNLQIYNWIIIGAEKLYPVKNHVMDVELELYYSDTTTIGYTYSSSTRIWMNTKYFDRYTPVQVAGNLMHEWLHKLGFGHDSAATAQRPYSVPYGVGYIIRRLASSYSNP